MREWSLHQRTESRWVLTIAWAAYSVPFVAAYGNELSAFLREWKELAGAALGVIGAFWVASFTSRQNTLNAMRQSEALLTQGDLESLLLDVQNLRRYSIVATDYQLRLGKLVQRYIHASEQTKLSLLQNIKSDFCDVPTPKELDPFNIANDPRAITPEIERAIIQFHHDRVQLSQLLPHAVNPMNKAEELRDSCFLIASSMVSCCHRINEHIERNILYLGKVAARDRARYAKLRTWDHN